jgi:asparagine synthase (glutamine-hydrolysing)
MKARLYASETLAALADSDPAASFRAHFARPGTADLLARLSYVDLMTFLPDNLLLFSDKTSMASSLELRVPLLDLDLVEFAAGLPDALRVRRFETKYLLRKAVGPLLPPAVLAKPKQGFTAPVGRWIRRELAGYAEELLSAETIEHRGMWDHGYVATLLAEHRAGRREWGYQLFGLMVFELWCRTFLDQAPSADRRPSCEAGGAEPAAAGAQSSRGLR